MKKILIAISLLGCNNLQAQYQAITHTDGNTWIGKKNISVNKLGQARTGGGLCNVNDYWIGYGEDNGYKFTFNNGASKLNLLITVVNKTDTVELLVDGKPYQIPGKCIKPYNGGCVDAGLADVNGNLITSHTNFSNVALELLFENEIHELVVRHTAGRGKGGGVAFSISIAEIEKQNSGEGYGATSVSTSEHFSLFNLYPNPTVDNVNISFIPLYSGIGIIQVKDVLGRIIILHELNCQENTQHFKSIDVSKLIAGTYYVDFLLNGYKVVNKLVKI